MMKLLYFFSNLCAVDPVPHPETNSEGIPIQLRKAQITTSAAPKIPNPNTTLTQATILPLDGPSKSGTPFYFSSH